MTPVDLTRLRAMYVMRLDDPLTWRNTISAYAPALMDELEAARAEVEQLRTTMKFVELRAEGSSFISAPEAARRERSAIVAWLRNRGVSPYVHALHAADADAIERGEHNAGR